MLRLEKISGKNVEEILRLRVAEAQRSFVAANDRSLIDAYLCLAYGGQAFPFGIYEDDTPVGFLMISYDVDGDWEDPPAIAEKNYSIWRFMIDEKHQRKGYGRRAMELALEFIRTMPCGRAAYCWLSYELENEVARRLYQEFGFRETGERDGDEVIAVRNL